MAVEGAFADDRLRVLPRQHSRSGSPWLLKLHGDVKVPKSIVLTRENYLDLAARGIPLIGMVQSLLLTGHVLIVGYSLSDENVIRLAHQVRQVLEQGVGKDERVGTLLPLVEDPIRERLWRNDLHHVPMQTGATAEQGREWTRLVSSRSSWTVWLGERQCCRRDRSSTCWTGATKR